MHRFVAFIDILGFSQLIEDRPIGDLLKTLASAIESCSRACHRGADPDGDLGPTPPLLEGSSPLHFFSFSDTFVLSSVDDSLGNFLQITLGTSVLIRRLFAQGCPVRGAITCGEAEFIPSTDHLIGRAVIRAAKLEKSQDWFGVIIDPECITAEREQALDFVLWKHLFLKYPVPFKHDSPIQGEAYAINWRHNLQIAKGIRSIFPASRNPNDHLKVENTLLFSKHVYNLGMVAGRPTDGKGNIIFAPWARMLFVGECDWGPDDGY